MAERRITKIPFPGGSGRTPTGAMQFENDWPGLFIRGDNAVPLANAIRRIEEKVKGSPDFVFEAILLDLIPIAEIIERDVWPDPENIFPTT